MADKSKKESQSVDDIVDDIVDDMGVEDRKVPEETKDDPMAGLGGVFNVPSSSKRRKKKKKSSKKADATEASEEATPSKKERLRKKLKEEKAAGAEPEDAEPEDATPEAAPEEVAKEKPASEEKVSRDDAKEIAGIFKTSSDGDSPLDYSSDYLDEDDLGGHKKGGGTNMFLVAVILILLAVLGGVVLQFTDLGGDLSALFRGEYREKKLAEKAKIEADFQAEQMAKMEKFGTLNVNGSPLHSLVKLDGEVQYAPTSSGTWRELRVTSPSGKLFRNIKIKKPHTVELSSPGYKPQSFDLTEGMWEGGDNGGAYTKRISLNLTPISLQNQAEMERRMDTSDTEGDYFGTISINTIPAGANVIFNNHPLLDKKGEPMVTPVTFSEYYVKDEKSGKLEKKEINVDTPPDVGHKIEIKVPEELGEFVPFATPVQRQMWTCHWKDGAAPDMPAKGKSYRDYCDYKFSFDMDFKGLKTYIERREAEKERIKAKNEKMRAEVNAANGVTPDAGETSAE